MLLRGHKGTAFPHDRQQDSGITFDDNLDLDLDLNLNLDVNLNLNVDLNLDGALAFR